MTDLDNKQTCTTCASPTESLTSEKLEEAYELLSKVKKIVILFAPFLEGRILRGEWINKIMSLDNDEEGFIVPENVRKNLEEYRNDYREWVPGLRNGSPGNSGGTGKGGLPEDL